MAPDNEALAARLTLLESKELTRSEDYIPRREHTALNLERRMGILEEFHLKTVQQIAELDGRLRELIITTVGTAVKEALQKQLSDQDNKRNEQVGVFQWVASNALTVLFFLMNLLVAGINIYLATHH